MTKQHIFIIENNLQKIEQSFFHLSRRTTMIQDLLVRHQFSLVQDNRTSVNVEACCDVQHFLDLCLFLRYKWVKIDQHPQFIFFILSLILMGYSLALQPMLK
jgi:hypothetical protein